MTELQGILPFRHDIQIIGISYIIIYYYLYLSHIKNDKSIYTLPAYTVRRFDVSTRQNIVMSCHKRSKTLTYVKPRTLVHILIVKTEYKASHDDNVCVCVQMLGISIIVLYISTHAPRFVFPEIPTPKIIRLCLHTVRIIII